MVWGLPDITLSPDGGVALTVLVDPKGAALPSSPLSPAQVVGGCKKGTGPVPALPSIEANISVTIDYQDLFETYFEALSFMQIIGAS